MGIFDIFGKKKAQKEEEMRKKEEERLRKEEEEKNLIRENQVKYKEIGYQVLYDEACKSKNISEFEEMFWKTILSDDVMWGGDVNETFDSLDEYGYKTDKARMYMIGLVVDCKKLFPLRVKGNPFFEIIHNFNKTKPSNEYKIKRDNMSKIWNCLICIAEGDEERFVDCSYELKEELLSITPEEWGFSSREFAFVIKDKFSNYLSNPELRDQLKNSGLYLYEID